MTLVSTVMPVGRDHPYLLAALRSALVELPEGGEVVVVLDGPQVKVSLPHDHRLKVVSLPKKVGTPAVLNAGIARSTGDFVARLDSDDIAEPERLTLLLARMHAEPELACLGSWAHLIDRGDIDRGLYTVPLEPEEVRRQLLTRNAMIHSSVVFRRSALESVGGYNERCLRMQDYELFLRLSAQFDIANVGRPLIRYRVHSMMSSHASSPYGRQILPIMRARHRLAQATHSNGGSQAMRDLTWWGAQVLRYHGLRAPGHTTLQGRR